MNNERAVITRLQYIYDKSLFEINKKIRDLEFRIGDLTEEYIWADDGDKERIESTIQSKIYQRKYQEQLQAQIEGILDQMQTKQYLTVSDYLNECYEDGFVGALFDLHGQDVPLMMPINQEAMVTAVQLESKISQGLYTRLGEDVALLKKRIAAEITRAISTGASYSQVARQLANQTRIGYNKSIRIARTEGHRIQNTATMNAAHDAVDRGADLVKQWDATLDAKTRDSHVAVDGQIRELNEEFSNGLAFPGDPSGSAAEVVNCRCCLLQRARWAVGNSFTKWNNFTKQLETFESPESYDEFKKGFFSDENKRYMNYVQQMEDKYQTKDFQKILDRMTDRDYDKLSILTVKNPIFTNGKYTDTSNYGKIRLGVVRDAINSGQVSTTINVNKQNRHIPGNPGYTSGRSRLDISIEEAQHIVDTLAGTGQPIFDSKGNWTNKERVRCPDYIGTHVDVATGAETRTKNITIIYSGTGTHIVPRRDEE